MTVVKLGTGNDSQEDLADFAGDGKYYRLDIFDSFTGGWGGSDSIPFEFRSRKFRLSGTEATASGATLIGTAE